MGVGDRDKTVIKNKGLTKNACWTHVDILSIYLVHWLKSNFEEKMFFLITSEFGCFYIL